MKDSYRKPACIFYHTQLLSNKVVSTSVSRCVLRKAEDGSIEKFNIYGEWNDEKAMEFVDELHGCPFIRADWENQYTNEKVRVKCERCSKRVKWTKQHKMEVEAQRLENRGF